MTNRTRYNVWDLLADVGGFNDGLLLVAKILFSSYSAWLFKKDLLGEIRIDSDSKESEKSKSVAFQNS